MGIFDNFKGSHKDEALDRSHETPSRNAELLLESGLVAYREGRTEAAVKDLEAAFVLIPNAYPCAFSLGNAYARLGHQQKAVEAFKTCVRLSPERSEPHSNLANSCLALGDFASAVKEFEEAIRLDPGDRVAKTNLPVARMLNERVAADTYKETMQAAAAMVDDNFLGTSFISFEDCNSFAFSAKGSRGTYRVTSTDQGILVQNDKDTVYYSGQQPADKQALVLLKQLWPDMSLEFAYGIMSIDATSTNIKRFRSGERLVTMKTRPAGQRLDVEIVFDDANIFAFDMPRYGGAFAPNIVKIEKSML